MSEKEPVVLCAASSYEQKYYLNEAFSGLPTAVKEELQVMCVLYTADVGGILTLQFDEDGNLQFQVTSADDDFLFDEIGSVLKIKQYQAEKQELLEALELYSAERPGFAPSFGTGNVAGYGCIDYYRIGRAR